MILGFYGDSNSGKTTLIGGLITELKKENLKIVVIKHIHRENFSIDNKAKDTGKFKSLGVDVVALSPNETAFILGWMKLDDIISKLQQMNGYDLILIEGLKKANIPKIRVGNCEMENNTIMSVEVKKGDEKKNIESQKMIVKWIINNLKKERTK